MKADLLRLDIFCDRNDGSEFGGSIYQKVSDNLETAVNLAWTAGNNSTRFGIAAKYQLDSSASLSVSRFPYLFFFFFFSIFLPLSHHILLFVWKDKIFVWVTNFSLCMCALAG